ncbi:MAG: sulfatase [Lacipirellulaceae bacterium]
MLCQKKTISKWVVALFIVAAEVNPTHAEPITESTRPNFLVFIADDLNKEYYGCYGNEQTAAPTASQLAAEGMVFENAFTGQAICAPSRSMLYTGKYPLRNGAFMNHSRVYQGTRSVCHYLRDASYDVILCGKSHVKPDDAFPWTITMHSAEPAGNPAMYTKPAMPLERLESYLSAKDESNGRPFCIIASSFYPHGEHPTSTEFTADKVSVTRFQNDNRRTRESEARFCQAIKNSDDELAGVLALLDKYELAENTLVIYVSDHGRFGKWTVYDRGLNVPFIARWPGVIKEGTRTTALVSFADVLPTMLELAGVDPVRDLDGKSFLGVLKGRTTTHQDYGYGVMTNQGIINAHVFPGRMIRSARYKYIRNYNAMAVVQRREKAGEDFSAFLRMGAELHPGVPEEELFDLDDDPEEQNNLATNPAYQATKAELKQKLQEWLVAQNDFLKEPGKMPLLHTSKTYRLDQRHPRRKTSLPTELLNSLDDFDFYKHQP